MSTPQPRGEPVIVPETHEARAANSRAVDAVRAEPPSSVLDPGERNRLVHRARRLEYATVGWNAVEAVVSITAAVLAGSAALLGFGVDSLIESSSGLVLLWRLQHGEVGQRREALALRLVGLSLLALAGYVVWEAGAALWHQQPPDVSPLGMAIAATSVVVMPLLARAKRRVARKLDSRALHSDSKQTDVCAWLSAILLAGLGLNALFGWWWADPAAALLMTPLIAREGLEALRGEICGCP